MKQELLDGPSSFLTIEPSYQLFGKVLLSAAYGFNSETCPSLGNDMGFLFRTDPWLDSVPIMSLDSNSLLFEIAMKKLVG